MRVFNIIASFIFFGYIILSQHTSQALPQSSSASTEQTLQLLSEELKRAGTGTFNNGHFILRDNVEYVRVDGCMGSYRKTSEQLAPCPPSVIDRNSYCNPMRDEWTLNLADLDPAKVRVRRVLPPSGTQEAIIYFRTIDGKQTIKRLLHMVNAVRPSNWKAEGSVTIHDVEKANRIATVFKQAIELCRR